MTMDNLRLYSFGSGKVVVTPGLYGGQPAVFIGPSLIQGEVGASADRENRARDKLLDGEIVLTFPTQRQADDVEVALIPFINRQEINGND